MELPFLTGSLPEDRKEEKEDMTDELAPPKKREEEKTFATKRFEERFRCRVDSLVWELTMICLGIDNDLSGKKTRSCGRSLKLSLPTLSRSRSSRRPTRTRRT